MAHFYQLFGFSAVSNVPIPGLKQTTPKETQVEIFLGQPPWHAERSGPGSETIVFRSSILLESGDPSLTISKCADCALTHLVYGDGTEFWFGKNPRSVWSTWPESLTIVDAATYLLGPVFGVFLRQIGTPCLHASAVVLGGKAILFAGDQGAGKSTTAAALAQRGHAVLTDDIVPIAEHEGGFDAVPTYPYLSLCQESVEMLNGPGARLPVFSPSYDKSPLPLGNGKHRFQESPVPIGRIFVLGGRNAGQQATIESLSKQDSLLALVANSYATDILDGARRASEFEILGRIVRDIPVHRLHAHYNLSDTCDLIEAACGVSQSRDGLRPED